MLTFSGSSSLSDIPAAIKEATQDWPKTELIQKEGMIFCFYAQADLGGAIAATLRDKFPHVLIAGCSTAGEWLNSQHHRHHLVMMCMVSSKVHWSVGGVTGLSTRSDKVLEQSIQQKLDFFELGFNYDDKALVNQACLTLIDGLSLQEERFVSLLSNCLLDIPMLGGSSGDNLCFEQTSLLYQNHDEACRVMHDSAVLVCIDSDMPLQTIKHEHFNVCDTDMVVTSASPKKRMVHRLNGVPAASFYADKVGCDVENLSPEVFSQHPLIYAHQGENLIRSIQKVEADGSLRFFCQVEEGVILNMATARSMKEAFDDVLQEISRHSSTPKVAIVFNCILRALESDKHHNFHVIPQALSDIVPAVIGLDNYGEQWYGKHLNQTFVALIFYG